MKTMRQKYFENYERVQVPADNRRGFKIEYRYKADWFAWDLDTSAYGTRRIRLVLTELFSIAVYLGAAFTRSSFNTVDLAAGFAMTSIIAWIAELWGIFRFSTVRQPMTVGDYQEIKDFTTVGSGIRFVLLLLATGSGLFFLLRGGQIDAAGIFAAAGHLISGLCSLWICHVQGRTGTRQLLNEDGKPGREI